MSDRLAEFGYLAAWRLVRAFPQGLVRAGFQAGADHAWRRGGTGVTRLADNLKRVSAAAGGAVSGDDFEELVRAGMRSYARYWMEAFRLPALSRDEVHEGFVLHGADMLAADVAQGRGAVVALPHAGNYDLAGAWVAAQGWPITVVAERLRPEGLYRRFLAYREQLGMRVVPHAGGAAAALAVLTERLTNGSGTVVALLADRDLSARGVPVTFFGAQTRMPPGPALLALRTGAPLYTVGLWYEPDRAHARLTGPVSLPGPEVGSLDVRVARLTQQVADGLAAGIAQYPADWHMMQRMWLSDPEPDAPAVGGDRGP